MSKLDWDNMSEDEQNDYEKKENKRIRRNNRAIREAILDKITKDEDSEQFPNIDGSNKQVYAITTVLDGMDRDVQESEKALAAKDSVGNADSFVTAVFERLMDRTGDPSGKFAIGEAGMRTVGDDRRLRPENTASGQHMHVGKDEIEYDEVFHKKEKK